MPDLTHFNCRDCRRFLRVDCIGTTRAGRHVCKSCTELAVKRTKASPKHSRVLRQAKMGPARLRGYAGLTDLLVGQ